MDGEQAVGRRIVRACRRPWRHSKTELQGDGTGRSEALGPDAGETHDVLPGQGASHMAGGVPSVAAVTEDSSVMPRLYGAPAVAAL